MAEKRYSENETERFKQETHLPTLAQDRYGMVLDKRKSTSKTLVLQHPDGADRFIMSQNPSSGHWTYFESGAGEGGRDSGTVIDFVQNRENLSFTQAKDALREYLGNPEIEQVNTQAARQSEQSAKEAEAKKLERVDLENKMRRQSTDLNPSNYLMQERGIERQTLEDPRFAPKVRTNRHGTAIFPYTTMKDRETESSFGGYEMRGAYEKDGETKQLRHFAQPRGVEKGVWVAGKPSKASHIVITEAPIDALSYAQHIGDVGNKNSNIAYVATGGSPSSEAQRVLGKINQMNPEASMTLAMDHGEGGKRFEERVSEAMPGKAYDKDLPGRGKDWNEEIQINKRELEKSQSREPDTLQAVNSMVDQARGNQNPGLSRDEALANAGALHGRDGLDEMMKNFQKDIEQEVGSQNPVHSAQGTTVENAIVAGEGGRTATANTAYVAESRKGLDVVPPTPEVREAWEVTATRPENGMSSAAKEAKRANDEKNKERDDGRGRDGGEGRGSGSPGLRPDMSKRDAPGMEMSM